ncbi:uncharacterized protein BT62DRAFT_891764 [Guyanagaster necrorhizus]|uniref:Thioesterase domain-containing protein n=1 Tax=Guyanagaster necrorhizus TaxID=856835 RepID=A0A9P8ATZ9_9AGAR|nr:uncharacterized protein BT62DRAFT_891764 [Guyanagaster necrorhizus MCA 3950]KAG7447755.1 hypothetical protein BT62DRAFT_891764 [Guyanagaster necrorhizus MCA 3950]
MVEKYAKVTGNAPDDVKQCLCVFLSLGQTKGFAHEVLSRLSISHVSLDASPEQRTRDRFKVVCSLTVTEDMLDATPGNMHGGCSAFIIDTCSSLGLVAYVLCKTTTSCDWVQLYTISQTLDVMYHSSAFLGDGLEIVSTGVSVGARAMSIRTEIWNTTRQCIVASGVHLKMLPSSSRAKM